MRSFRPGLLDAQPKPMALLRTLTRLGEAKGKEVLFARQSPQTLDTLRDQAVFQSTESSNRIEAITAPLARVTALVHERTTPRDRSEQEIAGYRDVLKTIHASWADIPITSGVVLQLHRDLYRYSPAEGGRWKPKDNEITAHHPDGRVEVRFKAVSAVETPAAMDQLHEAFARHLEAEDAEPLLLIPAYVLDFLCIHPFSDGNGRMARLLTLLLLYRAGFQVGRYVSLERIMEETKEGYYDTLYRAAQDWHDGRHELVPWWDYMLGVVLLTAYGRLEERVSMLTEGRGAKGDRVREAVERLPRTFRVADVEAQCPGVSRMTITRTLYALRDAGRIRCLGKGRDASWERLDTP